MNTFVKHNELMDTSQENAQPQRKVYKPRGMDMVCQTCGNLVPDNKIHCHKCASVYCSTQCQEKQHAKHPEWCTVADQFLINATRQNFAPAGLDKLPVYNNENIVFLPGPITVGEVPHTFYSVKEGPGKKAFEEMFKSVPQNQRGRFDHIHYFVHATDMPRAFWIQLTNEQRKCVADLMGQVASKLSPTAVQPDKTTRKKR